MARHPARKCVRFFLIVTTVTTVATVATVALTACETDKIPFFSKTGDSAPSTEKSAEKPAAKGQAAASDIRPKEITTVAPMASVVMDKHCHEIVQPYKLSDNLASLGMFGAKQLVTNAGGELARAFGTSAAAPTQTIPASVKLAAKQLNWLPMRAEKLYGDRLHAQETNILARTSALGKKYYPLADAMLQEILSKVGHPHDYQFQLFILKNDTLNAVARPGGYVYMDQGLVDNPVQRQRAYFALAHEIAHVLQRHETQGLQSMIIDSITLKGELTKIISGVNGNPAMILEHVKTGKNLFIRHHIDQELQADSCGAKLLSRVFPDQRELAGVIHGFLKDLPKTAPGKPAPAPASDVERLSATVYEIVKTPIARHPDSPERYSNLNMIFAEISKEGGSTLRTRNPLAPRTMPSP